MTAIFEKRKIVLYKRVARKGKVEESGLYCRLCRKEIEERVKNDRDDNLCCWCLMGLADGLHQRDKVKWKKRYMRVD